MVGADARCRIEVLCGAQALGISDYGIAVGGSANQASRRALAAATRGAAKPAVRTIGTGYC
jgi:hypothetical protein